MILIFYKDYGPQRQIPYKFIGIIGRRLQAALNKGRLQAPLIRGACKRPY